MARSQTRRSVIGLDIEPGYLAAARVSVNGKMAIEQAATAPLDPGVMRDGEVVDIEGLGEALKGFFREHGLSRRVRLGVANQRIVVRNGLSMDLADRLLDAITDAVRYLDALDSRLPSERRRTTAFHH